MSETIKIIIEDQKFNFDTQIQLCESIILSLSKEQLNECSIKHSYTDEILNVVNKSLSLLMYLGMNKKYECLIHFLLTNRKDDIDINLTDSYDKFTALFYAVYYSNVYSSENIVKMLINAGSNINMLDKNTRSLLHISMLNNNSSDNTAQILIDAGININVQDNNGLTPLMTLFYYFPIHKRVINKMMILIRAKTNVNLQDKNGLTTLMYVTKNISSYDPYINDIIIALLEAGADINIKDNKGKTVFDYAKPKIRDLLIDTIIELQSKELVEKNKFTILEQKLAAEQEEFEALKQELIVEKINVQYLNKNL